jgi:hypothetical protein
MFVLSTKFLDNAFKMNINWPVAVILCTLNWKSREGKLICSYNFLYLICALSILWLQGHASREESIFPTEAKPVQ